MQTDQNTQPSAEPNAEPDIGKVGIMGAIKYFADIFADARDYKLREDLRAAGYNISLPQDDD